jgi:hypothetical protein
VPLAEALPGDVGANERRIDVGDLALGDPRFDAGPDHPREDPPEQLRPPTLANARQRRVVRQDLVQPVARKPADRNVDLCLPQQPPVMYDPQQEAREHQTHGGLRVDPRTTDPTDGVEVTHLGRQPR